MGSLLFFLIGLTSISSTGPLFTKPAAIHAVSPDRVTRPAVTLWTVRETVCTFSAMPTADAMSLGESADMAI